ncbi:hypothetical protein H072_2592 [Dactylellina haptotyla CBS 200.50]|uniref:SCP domain-containing protein n=1 Tax=Dactylellina haptotyla (strain CBS 200.50) TaxID=1284197 RepID=S8AK88_DACHA|nr:hypothetical protein H072_2592 [Dactylellina haptotyla CBS 200.50]
MRFTTLFGTLAAISTVASHPAPNEAPAVPIKVKDIDLTAPNGELVIGTIRLLPNTSAPAVPKLEKKGLDKRADYIHFCYNGPYWINQNPDLMNAKNAVCNYLRDNNPVSYGNGAEVSWQHYQDQWGNWIHIAASDGNTAVQTKWTLWAAPGSAWSWDWCFNTFWNLISACPGSNPDSAGGYLQYNNNGWSGQLTTEGI